MKKTFRLIIVTIMLTLVVTACGNDSSPTEKTEDIYPSSSINIIAPYNPGGDTDFNARVFSQYLPKELDNQAVVVTNVSGTGGSIGSREAKDARADGYTTLFMHPALLVNQLSGTADFGLDDFEIPAIVGASPGEVIAVRGDSGFKTIEELIEYSKKNPGVVNVAADVGTMTHIIAMQMEDAGAKINIVSAGGASERVAAILGGHIDVIINSYGTIADYLTTGELVALGHTNSERSEGFPDIPTCVEQGYDIQFPKYYFFAMPKGTPKEVLDIFSEALESVVNKEEYQKQIFDAYGQEPVYLPQEEAVKELKEIDDYIQKYKERF